MAPRKRENIQMMILMGMDWVGVLAVARRRREVAYLVRVALTPDMDERICCAAREMIRRDSYRCHVER